MRKIKGEDIKKRIKRYGFNWQCIYKKRKHPVIVVLDKRI